MKIGSLFCLLLLTAPCATAGVLETTLAKVDANAAAFRSASANLRYTTHNAVVDVDNTQDGTLLLKRSGAA